MMPPVATTQDVSRTIPAEIRTDVCSNLDTYEVSGGGVLLASVASVSSPGWRVKNEGGDHHRPRYYAYQGGHCTTS
jgi:hypothetical protein